MRPLRARRPEGRQDLRRDRPGGRHRDGRVLFEWHSLAAGRGRRVVRAAAETRRREGALRLLPHQLDRASTETGTSSSRPATRTRSTRSTAQTAKVLWRLGGKKSDFQLGPGAKFAWQHDARRRPDGTITHLRQRSRAAVEKRVARARPARWTQPRTHGDARPQLPPPAAAALAEPGQRAVPAERPRLRRLGREAVLHASSHRSGACAASTRASAGKRRRRLVPRLPLPWAGIPRDRPAVAASDGTDAAYASWNGATEVARWQVLAGPAAGQLKPVQTVAKNGFETPIRLKKSAAFYAVKAVGRDGRASGRPRPLLRSPSD